MSVIAASGIYSPLLIAWSGGIGCRSSLAAKHSDAGTRIAPGVRAMTMNTPPSRKRQLIGRVMLTFAIMCGASCTILLVSGILRAIEQVDRVSNTLADLSDYIADGHAWIRGRVATAGSLDDDALAHFAIGVERRMAQFRDLRVGLERQTTAQLWTRPLLGNVDVLRVDAERRDYVTAASDTVAAPVDDRAMGLRRFDLHAEKLIQTVEAVRDSAQTARTRALIAADGIVALSAGIGVLLIAFLIWHPAFGGARPLGQPIGT
jgi:hypothetical protein